MENELQILESIEKNNNVTQRDISRSTGMSLGNVNILIKRLVKKGLLKMEKLSPRTIRYIITPKGMAEKLERTYRYIAASVRYINEMDNKMEALLGKLTGDHIDEIILFGDADEIYEMLVNKLKPFHKKHMRVSSYDALEQAITGPDSEFNKNAAVIAWQPMFIELLQKSDMEYINLLENI